MTTEVPQATQRDQLVEHLLTHSVKTGEFTLKSGRKSNWFIDSKQTICDPVALRWIAELAFAEIPSSATAIGGMTVGADPVGYGLSALSPEFGRELRSFTIRKEAKDHGMQGRVAGALRPGDQVVLVEDTVTRGSTLAEACEVVRSVGAEPVMMLAVVDRGGTCAAVAESLGLMFVALVTALELGFDYELGGELSA